METQLTDEQLQDACSLIRTSILAMQSARPKGSIVFPAYNEEKYLLKTVAAIAKIKTAVPIEIIGVSNACTDRTSEIIKQFGLILVEEKRKGLCFARQAGLESAKGRIIFQTDADTQVPQTWVDVHYEHYRNKSVVGCLGFYRHVGVHPIIRGYFLSVKSARFIAPNLFAAKKRGYPFVVGANFSYLKDVAMKKDNGSFLDSNAVAEDKRLLNRLIKSGEVRFSYDPKIVVKTSGRKLSTLPQATSFLKNRIKEKLFLNEGNVNPVLELEDVDVR